MHWIDAGIDTGALLARRKFPLNKRSTQERVVYCAAVIGSRLVQRIARVLQEERMPQEIDTSAEPEAYCSMPQRREFLRYRQRRRFFRLRDLIRFVHYRH